ncbi:hypothetical protein ACMSFO_03295 [Bacteroides thetaiotaomicron]|uniref:hypothetical protein n=1 Tax=Bacteroides thetaiotaomicron TaxID=818 RepID=UPI0039C17A2A
MKTRKWPLLLMAILTVLSMSSCQDWGEADPPAGNQKLPAKPDTSAKLIAELHLTKISTLLPPKAKHLYRGKVLHTVQIKRFRKSYKMMKEKVELCTPTADTSAFPTLLSVQISRQESHLVSS